MYVSALHYSCEYHRFGFNAGSTESIEGKGNYH